MNSCPQCSTSVLNSHKNKKRKYDHETYFEDNNVENHLIQMEPLQTQEVSFISF